MYSTICDGPGIDLACGTIGAGAFCATVSGLRTRACAENAYATALHPSVLEDCLLVRTILSSVVYLLLCFFLI